MGLRDKVRSLLPWAGAGHGRPIAEGRMLDVPSGENFRELGGYDTPDGKTAYRRLVRAGSTSSLSEADLRRLEDYGVRLVIDLRSEFEAPRLSDRFARRRGVSWVNVPLFDYNLSDPRLAATRVPEGNYLIDGYVTMLSNRQAIRDVFESLAQTPVGSAALFHCAAGMDRTGMTAMLLLGLAGVSREQIVADYLYSFAPVADVDRMVFGGERVRLRPGRWNPLPARREAVEFMLDRVQEGYGSTRAYLAACGLTDACLDAVRGMLLGHTEREVGSPTDERPGAMAAQDG